MVGVKNFHDKQPNSRPDHIVSCKSRSCLWGFIQSFFLSDYSLWLCVHTTSYNFSTATIIFAEPLVENHSSLFPLCTTVSVYLMLTYLLCSAPDQHVCYTQVVQLYKKHTHISAILQPRETNFLVQIRRMITFLCRHLQYEAPPSRQTF